MFGTVHAPLFNPIIAAKKMVTADHIGAGRFGLNIVVGWNEGEFGMFGAELRDHQSRYEYAQEWIDAIKGGRAAYSNFDIAAYLTEIILLGTGNSIRFPRPEIVRPLVDGRCGCQNSR